MKTLQVSKFKARETVTETLQRLRPLLLAEEAEFELPPRDTIRPDARDPFPEDD